MPRPAGRWVHLKKSRETEEEGIATGKSDGNQLGDGGLVPGILAASRSLGDWDSELEAKMTSMLTELKNQVRVETDTESESNARCFQSASEVLT